MISASLPGEALAQLGQLGQLSHLYPPPPTGMTPEFLAPQPRPPTRFVHRRRDVLPPQPNHQPAPSFPVPNAYAPFLHHPSYASYFYRSRGPQTPPSYGIRPRISSSGFVPPAPAPHSPPVSAPAPAPIPRDEPPMSPERGAPVPYFCRGVLIRLENGTLRRVEEMRTEDFVMSAERDGEHELTQCTLRRLEERGERLSLTLAYERNRQQIQVELDSTVEHPFFVYGRGWASCRPERTLTQYGLRVQRLQVGDVCVTLVPRKPANIASMPVMTAVIPTPAPPQTDPENLSMKEDAKKRRWSDSDLAEDDRPPLKKR